MLKFAAGFFICWHLTKPKNLRKVEALLTEAIDNLQAKKNARENKETSTS